MTTTNKQFDDGRKQDAIDGALEALDELVGRMESFTRDVRNHADYLRNHAENVACGINVKRSSVFEWAINDAENLIRNMNFAALARRCATLAKYED